MFQDVLADWKINLFRSGDEVTISVENKDGSPVYEVVPQKDGRKEDLIKITYRLTSQKIESRKERRGYVLAALGERKLWIGDILMELVNDVNNHLNLKFSHVTGADIEHVSSTNGVIFSPSCEIVFSVKYSN